MSKRTKAKKAKKTKKVPRPEIKCPHCGNDNLDDIRFIEDVISSRRLCGFDEKGKFIIDGESHEDMEDASNQRFECHSCWEQFPMPKGLHIDWRV